MTLPNPLPSLEHLDELSPEQLNYVLINELRSVGGPGPREKLSLISALLDAGADTFIDCFTSTPLHHAAYYGDINLVKKLIDIGVAIDTWNRHLWPRGTALHYAAWNGHYEVVDILLKAGANFDHPDLSLNPDPNSQHDDAVLRAIKASNWKVLSLLLNHGLDISWVHIHKSAEYIDLEIFRNLLLWKGDFELADDNNYTILHECASYGRLDLVKHLIECGVNVNATDIRGVTSLHLSLWSRSECHHSTALYLIAQKASLDARDQHGKSALHLAAQYATPVLVREIVERGGDIEARDGRMQTPIFQAVRNDNLFGKIEPDLSPRFEILRLLLSYGANINAQDIYGYTPLHHSIRDGDMDIATELINAGASLDVRDRTGQTPLDYAKNSFRYSTYLSKRHNISFA